MRLWLFTILLSVLAACSESEVTVEPSPSDDPADYIVDTTVSYRIEVSEPEFIIPSDLLPPEARSQASNNNVDVEYFDGRLFVGWRTGPTHFASEDSEMLVVSSADGGQTWDYETKVVLGTDVREPRFLKMGNELQMLFFEAGTYFAAFEPVRVLTTFRRGLGDWGEIEVVVDEPEVPWDLKVRNGLAYLTSYTGGHYVEDPELFVHFKFSEDGRTWDFVEGRESVYVGGVSEVAFEFGSDGRLWIVTRNEDGDASGYGAHVCVAEADALSEWDCPSVCDPERYDSPEMFRHGDDIYLVARRDIGGPYGDDGGDMVPYSLRPKRTALYQIDQESKAIVHLFDIPGVGDTAFPAIRRISAHKFLLANYTSPLDDPDVSWLTGQTSSRGTQIYLSEITFVPEAE